MAIYKIPALYCPFEPELHPMAAEIQAHTDQWVKDFGLLPNDTLIKKYEDQKFGSIIARSYPYGGFRELCYWCDLNTALFLLDDYIDETDRLSDESYLKHFVEEFMELLTYRNMDTQMKKEPLFEAMLDFWNNFRSLSSVSWQNRFVKDIQYMFEGGFWQYYLIQCGNKPTLEDYVLNRQYLGAAHLATNSLEVTAGVRLLPEEYDIPIVNELTTLSRNAICFANDLFSLGKEMENSISADFNLVSILREKLRISIDEAIQTGVYMHNSLVREFIELSHSRFIDSISDYEELEKYIKGLEALMRGNIDWSTQDTTRYPHIYIRSEYAEKNINC